LQLLPSENVAGTLSFPQILLPALRGRKPPGGSLGVGERGDSADCGQTLDQLPPCRHAFAARLDAVAGTLGLQAGDCGLAVPRHGVAFGRTTKSLDCCPKRCPKRHICDFLDCGFWLNYLILSG